MRNGFETLYAKNSARSVINTRNRILWRPRAKSDHDFRECDKEQNRSSNNEASHPVCSYVSSLGSRFCLVSVSTKGWHAASSAEFL